jgi:hypothetical protein
MLEAKVIFGALIVCGLIKIFVLHSPEDSEDWAAWVQAIGSIGAILIAIWVVDKQHQQAIDLGNVRRKEVTDSVFAVTQQCCAMVKTIPGFGDQVEAMEVYLRIVPKAHFENLLRLINDAPVYELRNQNAMVLVLDCMEMMDRTRRLLDTIAAMSRKERMAKWHELSTHVGSLQLTASRIAEGLEHANQL